LGFAYPKIMLLQMAWNCIFQEVVLIDEDFAFGYSDWYTAQKTELPRGALTKVSKYKTY
jgi:hypothetical protein